MSEYKTELSVTLNAVALPDVVIAKTDIDGETRESAVYTRSDPVTVDTSTPDDPKCTGCGGSLAGNEKYCPGCGRPLKS